VFNERDPRLGGEVGSDVNRDGNPAGSSGVFAVLWDTDANLVCVDTNQNNDFADDMAMTDYKVNYDVNYFGVDNPATAVASACRSSSRPTAAEQGRQHRHRLRRARLARGRHRRRQQPCSAAR
jgi:hypothetical protein